MKYNITASSALTELFVSVVILITLFGGVMLVTNGTLSVGRMLIAVVAVFGSFGPVIAISALPGNLTQTFASGDRVLNLLSEKPAVTPVTGGENLNMSVSMYQICHSRMTGRQRCFPISVCTRERVR